MKNADTLLVTMSDLHIGSVYALTVGRIWQGQKTAEIHPTSAQVKIRTRFLKFAEEVKEARKNKKVVFVANGDLIDGDHHNSGDVFTTDMLEMSDLAIEILTEFKKLIGWARGDELYITRGTDVHTKNLENYIGRELGAVMDGDFHVHDLLKLSINGVSVWFVHHGPRLGMGANEGNGLRNWLRTIYIDSIKDGARQPDILYSGHVHQPGYAVFETRDKMQYKLMHAIITPSWQMKTRYAHMAAPVAKNKIGGVYQLITADGLIGTPQFSVMET